MELIRSFNKISKSDVSLAGGKGVSLGEMTQTGIPVPEGFVILSNAFERFIEETDLNVEIDSILHKVKHDDINTIENASEQINSLILSAKMPKDVANEIINNFEKLGAKYVAVRSSATSEDSKSAAWAGQLDSYLNTIEKTLLENVKKCWASLFTPRAIFYRFEKGLHKEKVSVAVVIQKMIESEVSGIAFSVHPVTQDYNQIIIEAGYGLGEAIVSGKITPDSYVIEKDPRRIIDKNITKQEKGLYRVEKGGNEWRQVKNGTSQKLNDSEILDLTKLILKIENHYGFPCDIEWAREKGKFYIVQSRPITTLQKKEPTEKNNNLGLGHLSDYTRLFQFPTMPYLLNDMLLKNYTNLKCIFLFKESVWVSYLPNEIVKKTFADGVKLFGNNKEFKEWGGGFENYKREAKVFFEKVITRDKLTKDNMIKFLEYLCGCHFFYIKTEFFYTNQAYLESKKNSTIKDNLKSFEDIKNNGRAFLNKMALESESYLAQTLTILGKQFNVSIQDLLQYTRIELVDLFDGKKVKEKTIKDRLTAYVCVSDGKKVNAVVGEKAKEIFDNFLSEINKESDILRGITANGGKVRGKVKMMFYGFKDFHRAKKLMEEMKKGEILVAETTSPEIMLACKKAAAILTNEGGLLSHAAIVSREMNIPCIVGLGNADMLLKDGDLVEVDADKGIVKIIKLG